MNRPVRSLSRRLTGLIVAGGVVSAVIAAAGFSWLDLKRFWARTSAEVLALCDIAASQVGPAEMLGDHEAAAEILGSLRADPRILDAVLYDSRGSCFASLSGPKTPNCPPRPPDGPTRTNEALRMTRPVEGGGERVGTLTVTSNLPAVNVLLRQYLSTASIIVLLSLIVAAILAVSLQRLVSRPVLAIAEVAQRVAETRCYRDRVSIESRDELGTLAGSFNLMLEEIERRDDALAQQKLQLEEQVAERNLVNAQLFQAKENAEEAARLKSEFLANMSHEIRTPMNGVIGMISLAIGKCSGEEQRDELQMAHDAAQSLVALLNDILDLSRIEAGRMNIESIDCDLHHLVTESFRMFDLSIRGKGLVSRLKIEAACPRWVKTDPVRLRQILTNLIGNAVKFTLEGGVSMALSAASGGVRIEIRDTGIGIPEEKLDAIFQAFTQADGSHTRRFGGTGLGLTITRRLVNLMGGKLWAESENGCGSRFFVELPLEECPAPPSLSPASNPSVRAADWGALRVLVAEDNPINQKVIQAMLRKQGWQVTLAGNGREAFDSFTHEEFDLVLMDVQMPEMDGLESARMIREWELGREGKHTPVIALTAHVLPAQHEQCLASGMDGVVTKPVSLSTLIHAVGEVLSAARAQA